MPHGRKIIRQDLTGHSGGVALMLRSHYQTAVQRDLCYKSKTLEVLTITLKAKQRLLISVIYRHPKATSSDMDILSDLLCAMSATGRRLYLLGDLNCDVNKTKPDGETTRLLDSLDRLHLSQLIRVPTRTTATSSSCIDLIITNAKNFISSSGVVEYGASDHDIVYVILRTRLPRQPRQTITIRSLKKMSPEGFVADLSTQDWSGVLQTDDASIAAERFTTIMQHVISVHAPRKEIKLKPRDSSPWLSDEIRSRMLQRDAAKIRARRTGLTVHWDIYRDMRNSITIDLRNARKTHYGDLFTSARSSKEKWKW